MELQHVVAIEMMPEPSPQHRRYLRSLTDDISYSPNGARESVKATGRLVEVSVLSVSSTKFQCNKRAVDQKL